MLNTKEVTGRRELRFQSLADLLTDAETLENARTDGNWTVPQIVAHVAAGIEKSLDGYGFRADDEYRSRARANLDRFLADGFPAGITVPAEAAHLVEPAADAWDEAIERLRRVVSRADGETMSADHPMLGPLTHEQWIAFHCRHAELHFSFVHPV